MTLIDTAEIIVLSLTEPDSGAGGLFVSAGKERAVLDLGELRGSLGAPAMASANLLDELTRYFPDAISFAAGRPFEGFFAIEDVHRYLRV